ncbi:helix-turn-helix domain-containing protein [Mesorhizobium sp. ESP7-2]|uniref:helix-turn-helix domain-containing protein n=1 Tax=Mesorhizobium sp. ESP7-2 TaxID=2876622 RepID=UPI001CCC9B31|nr:helix-turn-helix domain-containing protein [Mesorhizobium sp. ESP7-2]MBZ9706120.1 helix-turn-helix domain-containing protein [Mesorhizobium sp. ESP7-2]
MLLTQDEVAERLRCSTSKVKRLRISGSLAYIPGRPVMIEETDLDAYKERVKCQALPRTSKKMAKERGMSTGRKTELEDVSVLAQRIFLARQNSSRRGL